MSLRLPCFRSPRRLAVHLGVAFALATLSPPTAALAQRLSVGGAVELYEPADQGPPLGDPTSNQYFGGALAVGNFNGDLYQDLAIGIPEDTGGPILDRRAKAGTVALIYGGPTGLAMANAWYLSQPWSGSDPAVQEPGDHFGCALAAGDFDGDGVDDLAVGVCNETIGGAAEAGAVNVFYGVAFGTMGDPDLTLAEPVPTAGRHFGLALAAGDINGDGSDELVVAQAAGGFYFHSGGPAGLATTGSFVFEGGGTTIALGDFDGDGFADVVLGGPFAGWTAGDAFVYAGTASGLNLTAVAWLRQDFLVSDALDGGNEADDRFAESLLAADLDNDGYDDLVIGTPGEDVGPEGSEFVNAGAAYVVRGAPAGSTSAAPPTGRSTACSARPWSPTATASRPRSPRETPTATAISSSRSGARSRPPRDRPKPGWSSSSRARPPARPTPASRGSGSRTRPRCRTSRRRATASGGCSPSATSTAIRTPISLSPPPTKTTASGTPTSAW